MDDFETHPVGTAARIKQLENPPWHGPRVDELFLRTRIEQLEAAITRANAATAAAYEVAAATIEMIVSEAQKEVGSIKLSKVDAAVVEMLNGIANSIRALATADQTAALDKLIAEAEARVLERAAIIANKLLVRTKFGNDTLMEVVYSDFVGAAILAASKKGGV